MPIKSIPKRKRFFLAVEGRGEQSFIKWLGVLSDKRGGHITLDCEPINGGGYKSMLKEAIRQRKKKDRHKAIASILIVDEDRANIPGEWTLKKLEIEAKKHGIDICIQAPNQEGLFLRMMPGNEQLRPTGSDAAKELLRIWPKYDKPVDAETLAQKFTLSDLHRVARYDADLNLLLSAIGLM